MYSLHKALGNPGSSSSILVSVYQFCGMVIHFGTSDNTTSGASEFAQSQVVRLIVQRQVRRPEALTQLEQTLLKRLENITQVALVDENTFRRNSSPESDL